MRVTKQRGGKMKFIRNSLLITIALFFYSANAFAMCSDVDENYAALEKWVQTTKFDSKTKICPADTKDSPLYNLNYWTEGVNGGGCRTRAFSYLVSFYALFFQANPNYNACSFNPKPLVSAANDIVVNGAVCSDTQSITPKDCFGMMDLTILYLKQFNQPDAAFTMAQKTANSNDVTGLSQFFLGVFYYNGYGTDRNLSSAIQWLKVAQTKLQEKELQLQVNTFLALAYKAQGDTKTAQQYLQQCTAMGDKDCKKEIAKLS